VVKVDRMIRWHYSGYTITILCFRIGARQHGGVALKSAISAYSAIDRYQAQKVQAGGALIAPDSAISHDYVTEQRVTLLVPLDVISASCRPW